MQPIDQLLHKHDLHQHKLSIIASFEKAIKMTKTKSNEKAIPLGSSKMGGFPDLPEGWEYPSYEQGPLIFMLQINLVDVKPFDQAGLLPENGILYLFYDAMEQPWGFEEDEGCFKVMYFDGDMSKLNRREYFRSSDFTSFPSFTLSFEAMVTISEDPANLESLNEEEWEDFWNFRQELMQPEFGNGKLEAAHYLLGEPMNIQNDVFEELFENGKDPVLLFQIDSDEEDLGVLWGDCGMLYFCIEKEDLLRKQFDRVKFTLQCF
ncbi:YwqG family protein [Sutcliffiella deserti]|uniref:YwqG family protein n=1 Tax=Sutcliffiella deserti TaxID=2875501 RepID=UPI001CBADE3A|nr:YwqG family protein [Sutcliffiella deserti]